MTTFRSACETNNRCLMKFHVDSGANPNCVFPEDCMTPMFVAAYARQYEAIEFLVELGARDNVVIDGFTVLQYLRQVKKDMKPQWDCGLNCAIYALEGAPWPSFGSSTPLVVALFNQFDCDFDVFETSLKLYLDQGGSIDVLSSDGNTLMMHFVLKGLLKKATLMLKNGANADFVCVDGPVLNGVNPVGKTAKQIVTERITPSRTKSYVKKCQKFLTFLKDLEAPQLSAPRIEEGKIVYPNGDILEPTAGTLTMSNGQVFTGSFVSGKPSRGELTIGDITIAVVNTDAGFKIPNI